MKKFFSLLLSLAMTVILLSGCGSSPSSAETGDQPAGNTATDSEANSDESGEPILLRIGHSQGETSDWQLALLEFEKVVESSTNHSVEVELYPSETLGAELDNITSIQQGLCEGVLSGEALSNWTSYASLVSMPYAVNSLDDLITIAGSEEVGGVIESQIIESAKLHPIGFFVRSARNLTSNKPVNSIDDLKGVKIRVPNNSISVDLWNAYGADALPMAWSEVFTSLQNGTLDGQENPYANILSNNIQEVQKYLIKTEHTYSWIYVLIGEDVWQSMTEEQQSAIESAAQAMMNFQHDYIKNEVSKQEEELMSRMTFIDIDKTPFIEITKEVLKSNLEEDIYNLYLKMVDMNQ